MKLLRPSLSLAMMVPLTLSLSPLRGPRGRDWRLACRVRGQNQPGVVRVGFSPKTQLDKKPPHPGPLLHKYVEERETE
jgi:hypothetical protein